MATIIESNRLGGYITQYDHTNFSPAKTAHSFAKGQRFPTVEKVRNQSIGYNLPSTLDQRKTGFGHGQRFMTPNSQRSCSPPCTQYNLPSDFNIGNPLQPSYTTKKGLYTFGISHKHYQKVYNPECKSTQISREFTPGPGSYDSKFKTLGSEGKKWIIQGRSKMTNDPANISIKQNVPGPGHYPSISLNKYGVYKLSIMKNSKAARWSPSKKRFIDEQAYKKSLPGPGQYYPSDYNTDAGYVLSTNINTGSMKMRRDNQIQMRKFHDNTPGPGSYMQPSEFGYLDLYKYSNSPRGSTIGGDFSSRMNTSQMTRKGRGNSVMGHTGKQSNMMQYAEMPQLMNQQKAKKFKLRRNSNNSQMARTYQGAIFNPNQASNYVSEAENLSKNIQGTANQTMTGTSTPANNSGRR